MLFFFLATSQSLLIYNNATVEMTTRMLYNVMTKKNTTHPTQCPHAEYWEGYKPLFVGEKVSFSPENVYRLCITYSPNGYYWEYPIHFFDISSFILQSRKCCMDNPQKCIIDYYFDININDSYTNK